MLAQRDFELGNAISNGGDVIACDAALAEAERVFEEAVTNLRFAGLAVTTELEEQADELQARRVSLLERTKALHTRLDDETE